MITSQQGTPCDSYAQFLAEESAPEKWPITKVIFKESGTDDGVTTDVLRVTPGLPYHVKVEVLRSGGTTISSILFDGVDFGKCIAPGPNDDCSFHDCTEELNWKSLADNSHRLVSSPFGTVALDIDLKSLSKNCDCNKETWECGRASSIANGSPLISAIKITLTPLGKSYPISKSNIGFYRCNLQVKN